MSKLKRIVKEEINKLLKEVRYIDNGYGKETLPPTPGYGKPVGKNSFLDNYNQDPIRNTDKIRVFHKCDLNTGLQFALYGLSGKVRANRAFSYETGMNPKGLFVTTDFNVAKNGSFASYGVIIEFTAKATDLDTPVWNNNDSYFGQGSCPMPFSDKEERDRQKEKYNKDALAYKDDSFFDIIKKKDFKISFDHIRNSDNPALAKNIFSNNEHQALFIGDLNPNMIKRFWVKSKGSDQYIPYKQSDFIRKFFEKDKKKIDYKSDISDAFSPNDDFSWEKLAEYEYKYDSYYYNKNRERYTC